MALKLHGMLGAVKSCYEVEIRNMVHKADILEAVMGLRVLKPREENWAEDGNIVDRLCSEVHSLWWKDAEILYESNLTVIIQKLFERFGLHGFVAWRNQDAKSQGRMAASTALLSRRTLLTEDLVKLICLFLYSK